MARSASEWRDWAKEHLRGLENIIAPSYTPELELDEAGIRWDVRYLIRQGCTSAVVAAGPEVVSGSSIDEWKQMIEIVVDEADDRLLVAFFSRSGAGDWDQARDIMQFAASSGVAHATITYPDWFYPNSLEEIYQRTAEICEAGQDLGIVVWATASDDQYRFHPASVPFELYDRLVEIPNVVGMKTGFAEPGHLYELFSRYADKIAVNMGHPSMFGLYPSLARAGFHPQWAGTGVWEFWQSPEHPYITEMWDHFINGRMDEAMKIYWFLVEVGAFSFFGYDEFNIGTIDASHGQANWSRTKYLTWSVGGNGGPLPQPGGGLSRSFMQARKAGLRRLGITPREPDDEFYAGRVNYHGMKK